MPGGPAGEFNTHFALLVGLLAIAFAARFYFATQLLPAPVGDSVAYLEPIYNYCHGNQLTSYLWVGNVDPTGEHRFIWQGPLPPIVYRLLAKGCSLRLLFELRCALFLIIPLALIVLVRRGLLSAGAWFCLSIFCLAAVERGQFRPEYFCMIFVVLAYVVRVSAGIFLEGICWGCLFLSSPVSGGLYGVARAADSGPAGLRELPYFLAGAIPAMVLIFLLYPYHFGDWLIGMKLQALLINGRSDGDIYTYYIRSDFLPLWGFSLGFIILVSIFSNLRYLLLLPFVWYFGIRVPPTSYNVLTTVTLVFLQTYPLVSRRLRGLAVASLLVPGLLGLIQITARDGVSMLYYPDSFNRTQSTIASLIASGADIKGAPFFTFFSNPELYDLSGKGFPAIVAPRQKGGTSQPERILIAQESGSGGAACPQGTTSITPQRQRPWWLVFRTSSSWAINLCKYPPDKIEYPADHR